MSEQCHSQNDGEGCGLPAGHGDLHYSVSGLSGWTDKGETARAAWTMCGAAHPTAGFTCFCVKGHKGKHYALAGPLPDLPPTNITRRPFVDWPRK